MSEGKKEGGLGYEKFLLENVAALSCDMLWQLCIITTCLDFMKVCKLFEDLCPANVDVNSHNHRRYFNLMVAHGVESNII